MDLLQTKGPGEVVAEILMSRSAFSGCFLIVEGPSDSKLWRKFIALGDCEVVIAGCKNNATESIRRLDDQGFYGALAIVDDDYDTQTGINNSSENLVRTDHVDIEVALAHSDALERVLTELVDPASLERFAEQHHAPFGDCAAARASPLGRLRLFSKKTNAEISFLPLNVNRFCDTASWSLRIDDIIQALHVGHPETPPETFRAILIDDMQSAWTVCHGHDLIDTIVIGLRHKFGCGQLGRERVSKYLRLAFTLEDLRKTRMWESIVKWEGGQKSRRVLATSGENIPMRSSGEEIFSINPTAPVSA